MLLILEPGILLNRLPMNARSEEKLRLIDVLAEKETDEERAKVKELLDHTDAQTPWPKKDSWFWWFETAIAVLLLRIPFRIALPIIDTKCVDLTWDALLKISHLVCRI